MNRINARAKALCEQNEGDDGGADKRTDDERKNEKDLFLAL
ncbi:MAG: hypothetical protein NVS9B14_09470 [Candidatus Acidiferrum sp.]